MQWEKEKEYVDFYRFVTSGEHSNPVFVFLSISSFIITIHLSIYLSYFAFIHFCNFILI